MQKVNKYPFIVVSLFIAAFFILSSINHTAWANTSPSELSVTITPALSLAIVDDAGVQNLINLNIAPNAEGTFTSSSANIITGTTNETGLTITMSNSDDTTALSHTNSTITATIPTISVETTEAALPTNTYGYNFNNSTNSSGELLYLPVPPLTTPTTLMITSSQGSSTWPFTIGAKIDTTLPTGTYQDFIIISATANYIPRGIEGITTMQEMTSEICTASTIGDEAILTDTRDNKTYAVRKLADNKCWMVQNLALGDAGSSITLTSADSDVVNDFTIPANRIQVNQGTWNEVHVYNAGSTWIEPTSVGSDSIVHSDGIPPSQSQYVGNYYNYYTATAGTGYFSMDGNNATASICPKGWKLPTSGPNSDFTTLTNAVVGISNNTDSAPEASFSMQPYPNYFILSGDFEYSSMKYQGQGGYWWSSTIYNSSMAYRLGMRAGLIYPQGSNLVSNNSFSVRCIAR